MTPEQFAQVINDFLLTKYDWIQLRQIIKALKTQVEYKDES